MVAMIATKSYYLLNQLLGRARVRAANPLVSLVGASHRSSSSSSSISIMSTTKETFSQQLWKKSRRQSLAALYHPFVVSLAAGVLRMETFRHFIAQDAYFLQAFVKAYSMALESADDENAKLSISQLRAAAYEELRLHASFAQDWCIDLTKECQPSKATIAYTDFLMRTANGESVQKSMKRKVAAFIIGAMTPCMRLYAFLGQQIAKNSSLNEKNLYHAWVETYSTRDLEQSASQVEELLDSLACSLEDDERKELESVYFKALSFELEFFSAQPHCELSFLPFLRRHKDCDSSCLLISDFDSTCSVNDSCSVLAEASFINAIKKDSDCKEESSAVNALYLELKTNWDSLQRSYSEGYSDLLRQVLPEEGNYNFSLDHSGLEAVLERISYFEMQANLKVEESGVLKGLHLKDVKNAGKQILLQAGCSDFFKEASSIQHMEIHIISVCWSKTLICSALLYGSIPVKNVHANELDFAGFMSTGAISRQVETPFDKKRVYENLLEQMEKRQSSPVKTVYIGDSVTDLLCLLKADVGIVVGLNSNLEIFAKAFGVTLIPLYKGIIEMERKIFTKKQGILYSVKDWYEIHAFLLGFS